MGAEISAQLQVQMPLGLFARSLHLRPVGAMALRRDSSSPQSVDFRAAFSLVLARQFNRETHPSRRTGAYGLSAVCAGDLPGEWRVPRAH